MSNDTSAPRQDQSPTDSGGPASRRGAVVGLIVIMVLVVGGWLLVRVLQRMSQIQDCAMSGRTNCVPIDMPSDGDR